MDRNQTALAAAKVFVVFPNVRPYSGTQIKSARTSLGSGVLRSHLMRGKSPSRGPSLARQRRWFGGALLATVWVAILWFFAPGSLLLMKAQKAQSGLGTRTHMQFGVDVP